MAIALGILFSAVVVLHPLIVHLVGAVLLCVSGLFTNLVQAICFICIWPISEMYTRISRVVKKLDWRVLRGIMNWWAGLVMVEFFRARTMRRQMHGTINVGILCEEGIVIGNDCRTTVAYREGSTEIDELTSDEEVKIFQPCPKPQIFCTLMGDVEEWHNMYTHMLNSGKKSVNDLYECAQKYVKTKRGKHYGTIIAGYNKEGFQMKCVSTKPTLLEKATKSIAIGSGAYFLTGHLSSMVKKYKTLTKKNAVVICLQTLMMANFGDYFSGCKFRVTFVHKGGCSSETYQLLDVYNILYDLDVEKEKSTLFLIYSTSFGPIFGEKNVYALMRDLWSSRKDLVESNTIAKKAHFYVNRIVFANPNLTTTAYAELSTKNANPFFPEALTHIQGNLIDCIREKTKDHVYVGRSSRELLEGLCQLEDAHTLKY